MKFSIKDFYSNCDQTFTEEVLNGKLHFLCNDLKMVGHTLKILQKNSHLKLSVNFKKPSMELISRES